MRSGEPCIRLCRCSFYVAKRCLSALCVKAFALLPQTQSPTGCYPNFMRLLPTALATLALAALTGCHSHYVSIDVHNSTGRPITLVEVDYPTASFGVDTLATGATYHYRFKILGDGPSKILWTDAAQQEHTVAGPSLAEGQEGTLTVSITPTTATWQSKLGGH